MNTKNIISCGINNTIFIISNNIIIIMGSATWWLGSHSHLGILPRPKRQVVLGFSQAPCGYGAAIANRAFCQDPSARWRLVCPTQGPGSLSATCPYVGSASARCPLLMANSPTKTCADHFLPNQPFNAKCTPAKRQPHPSFAAFAILYVKSWTVITLLQFTMLCIYVNSNRSIKPF